MAGFDPKMVAGIAKKIKDAKGGSGVILDARKLELDNPKTIRLVKPYPNQGAEWHYTIEGLGYWINQRYYRSPASLGKPCPIEEEVQKARKLGDKSVKALLDDWKGFSRDYAFYMPIVPVEVHIDHETGEVGRVDVIGTERVLKAPVSMAEQIMKIVTNPATIAGSKGAGIFHRELGFSISLEKTGKGIDTKYTATLNPQRVPLTEEHYEPYNIVGMFEKELKSDEELRAAIRAYLYGEDYDTVSIEESEEDILDVSDEVGDLDELGDLDDGILDLMDEDLDL